MKNLRTYVLCTSFVLLGFLGNAQEQKIPVNEPDYNKPLLFENLPARISFNLENFTRIAGRQQGTRISTSLGTDAMIAFEGELASSVSKENGKVETIAIASSNYPGATFTLSKITKKDGSVVYRGRLLSFQHGDLYVLQQSNGQYELVKKSYHELVNE